MGLFNIFGGSQLTPRLALVAGMVYISAADGRLDANEALDISKIVPDRRTLEAALSYCGRVSFQQYLEEASRMLSAQQKMCVIVNCADMAMGDGHLAAEEQQRLIYMAHYFQIPEVHLQPYIQTLMVKNNLSIFPG